MRIHKCILHFMIKPSKNIRHGHSFDINSSDKGQTNWCRTRRLETLLNFPIRHIRRIFLVCPYQYLPTIPKFNNDCLKKIYKNKNQTMRNAFLLQLGRPQLGIVRRRTNNTYVFYTKIKNIYRKVNLRGVVKTSKGHTCEMVYDYL